MADDTTSALSAAAAASAAAARGRALGREACTPAVREYTTPARIAVVLTAACRRRTSALARRKAICMTTGYALALTGRLCPARAVNAAAASTWLMVGERSRLWGEKYYKQNTVPPPSRRAGARAAAVARACPPRARTCVFHGVQTRSCARAHAQYCMDAMHADDAARRFADCERVVDVLWEGSTVHVTVGDCVHEACSPVHDAVRAPLLAECASLGVVDEVHGFRCGGGAGEEPACCGACLSGALAAALGIPFAVRLLVDGRPMAAHDAIPLSVLQARVVRAHAAGGLLGGKGGFGANLKAAGKAATTKKTSNFNFCRDLHGRRVGSVNN
ncbi:hypothetical protein EON67_04790, partial [archaeon]